MAKSQNPMDVFRREQKKKELKKQKVERAKTKNAKLASMDPEELQDQIKKLARQVQMNPTDGPTRKRKQELEETLQAVFKKKKEMEQEEQQQEASQHIPNGPRTLKELEEANKAKYQCPENSIYYHPTLNPFGAPPPGRPQLYRVPPPAMARPPPPPQPPRPRGPPAPFRRDHHRPLATRPRGARGGPFMPPPPPSHPPPSSAETVVLKHKRAAGRPGKRPSLPASPPPPNLIQVPVRPPLPSGPVLCRPPPPPSATTSQVGPAPPPPPPPPPAVAAAAPGAPRFLPPPSMARGPRFPPPPPPPSLPPLPITAADDAAVAPPPAAAATQQTRQEEEEAQSVMGPMLVVAAAAAASDDDDEELAVAPYEDFAYQQDPDDDMLHAKRLHPGQLSVEDARLDEESQAQLTSMVPSTLRRKKTRLEVKKPLSHAAAVAGPKPVPRPNQWNSAAPTGPTTAPTSTGSSSKPVSEEYDAFMEEMKQLGAL